MHAQDAPNRLPLPMGQTLDTVPLSSISRLAAYAIALSKAFRGPVVHLLRTSHAVQYTGHLVSPDSAFGTVLPGNKWLLRDMRWRPRAYCFENGESHPLVFEGTVCCYAHESPNNGAQVVLAVVKAQGSAWYVFLFCAWIAQDM